MCEIYRATKFIAWMNINLLWWIVLIINNYCIQKENLSRFKVLNLLSYYNCSS